MRFRVFAIVLLSFVSVQAFAGFNTVPYDWEWANDSIVNFYSTEKNFAIDVTTGNRIQSVDLEKVNDGVHIDGAINPTLSPDGKFIAFTRDNDIYLYDIEAKSERRLTNDGSDLILNGYASWVYYEEIFGRPSRYRAFWWSPDSKKIAFYRFDNTSVPEFSIFSPFGQDGKQIKTRYPKAGEPNPEVKIGVIDIEARTTGWMDFNEKEDQYFGTPFWGDDSKYLYVSREPRLQNTLELFRVDVSNGLKSRIYHEIYHTWLDWIDGMLFSDKGLYMVRNFETGWQQIYFLSYDGKEFRRLTDGKNWRISLLKEDKGSLYFTAERDSRVHHSLYVCRSDGKIEPVSDPGLNIENVKLSPDLKYAVGVESNYATPNIVRIYNLAEPGKTITVANQAEKRFDVNEVPHYELITIKTEDGFDLYGAIMYPKNFKPSGKYPVHVDIYGGPDTPLVRDRWTSPEKDLDWYSENGIIQLIADCRAAGHSGRKGLDMIYRQLGKVEAEDFVAWAKYLQSLPYVEKDKIGVEGFSFGGTMTSTLVMNYPEYFHYGLAGGGVYDWTLYDSHYTERFMDTPENNPEGYSASKVVSYAENYPTNTGRQKHEVEPVMLRLTHGTGDDNVHFQNTLQLIDALQKAGKKFELMIYPDGMHGYRGYQCEHFKAESREFWLKYLKEE